MTRNIVTLLSGNALSQLVNVVTILFVVTAYFAPAEFGQYAVAMSYVGILSPIACLRYELAIVALVGERAANNVVFSSLLIATAFSAMVFVSLLLISTAVGDKFLMSASPGIIAALVFLKAVDQVGASILYRHEAYVVYSVLKLLQATVLLGSFVAAGVAAAGTNGLLVSTLLAYAVFAVAAIVVVRRFRPYSGVRLIRMVALVKRHRDFAKFSTPQTLIDNLLSNGLNFVLVVLAGPAVVGYFNYMQRILKAPLGLVFGAVSQVVFRFCAKSVTNADLVMRNLLKVFGMIFTVLCFAFLGVWLAFVFFNELTFLTDWGGLREYMIAFAVWMLVPFFFAPFATLPVVYGRQKQFFQLATTFNLASLGVLTLIMSMSTVVAAFWTVGLISIGYYAGLNAWLFRIVDSGRKS